MTKGIGASSGIALAKALVVKNEEIIIIKKIIEDVEQELNKFNEALALSKKI